ncbi:sterol 3-beta-glucosyltransferas-like protein [Westerdykella ornata]|uniref:Sterol 3-beta-glucosyltransferase n=1 Tax=Westerdykella ornata TaxID=318751 RepID=A0A6A6JCK7_WESOR|nr:sterol 3-beta-glucosyltransferas-like protein [Westerdykella ornata]KAF2273913.1 sterol 3-beta-glucosyltransferas-like protein [Westerdykella ornata]
MMASESRARDRPARKLTKRRRESRRVSLDIPERFKDGDDADDEDVMAPTRPDGIPINQSLFSLIARVGQQSQTNLETMHELDSGDSDDEGNKDALYRNLDGAARLSRISTSNLFQSLHHDSRAAASSSSKHRRRLSDHKLLRSLPKLKITSRKDARSDDMTSSQLLPPQLTTAGGTTDSLPNNPSRQPRASHDHSRKTEKDRTVEQRTPGTGMSPKGTLPLADRLQQIFEFDSVEDVIAEYPCWLLQSILLQGYLYITQKHVCFYAYIPKKHHDVTKTGYLAKRGRSKYTRYWFKLKGDVLSYYSNPEDLYFPRNRINLQYAMSAEVLEPKDKKKDEAVFAVTTDQRTYQFKADSAVSAKEWVRAIQKVIFRTHNEGSSVKISLPIQNILEIEESTILDLADTFRIRVIDNDETYAIDEYFFSFLSNGQDALNVLRIMVNDNEHHQKQDAEGKGLADKLTITVGALDQTATSGNNSFHPPQITENVRATLSPLPSPYLERTSAESGRSSLDINRRSADLRRSMDASRSLRRPSHETRRSFSGSRQAKQKGRDRSPLSPKPQDSSGSAANSLGPGTESSVAVESFDEVNNSASQILSGSDVFRAPTSPPPTRVAPQASGLALGHSDETARSKRPEYTQHESSTPSPQHPTTTPDRRQPQLGTPSPEGDTDSQHLHNRLEASTSTLQNIASYPIQKASGIAGFLRNRSKRVSGFVAAESMQYYEKVSGMLAGGRKRYTAREGLEGYEQGYEVEDDEDAAKATESFREHFALPDTEQLQSSFFASLQRILPNYGKIYISTRFFCFRGLMPGSKLKVLIPMRKIETVNKEKGFRPGYHALTLVIHGYEDLFFEFSKGEYREECAIEVLRIVEEARYMDDDQSSSGVESDDELAKAEHELLQDGRPAAEPASSTDISHLALMDQDRITLIFDDPQASIVDFKPSEPLNIVCLTIGSRGDVQPYIALCKALMKEGHKTRIATHAEFEPWVRKHGIDFAPVEGDPAELMRICVEHGMFTYSFMKETNSRFRGWLDGLCHTSWAGCQGADVLIESPSAMTGIHIAEALQIPYFRAFTMPWTRTRAYPHAFTVLERKLGGTYNAISYKLFNVLFWKAIAGQINTWRLAELGLQPTSLSGMQADLRPFLYNFSPSVVPPPFDWPDWIRVTGYWFLDEGEGDYEPPADLMDFIARARQDKKKLVYVGFGSIVIDNTAAFTKTVVDAVLKADVRCVLSKGWSERLADEDAPKREVPLPPEIFQIQSAPHDWLFKQMDAAVHHGGAGTTGASLRAGLPTVIRPFFGDQFFNASRVEDLGVGIWLKKFSTNSFGRALWQVTNDERIIVRAKVIGQKIRKARSSTTVEVEGANVEQENGVQVAIQTIYRELDRAKALVVKHSRKPGDEHNDDEDDTVELDDGWMMVSDHPELDVAQADALKEAVAGMQQASTEAPGPGGSSLAVGSMVLKGAATDDVFKKD